MRMLNAQDADLERRFFEALATEGDPRYFKRRCYLWNWVRGRGFYSALSHWMIRVARDAEYDDERLGMLEHAIGMVTALSLQDSDKAAFRSFAWNLTKHVPILTGALVSQLSAERIHNMLSTKTTIYTDEVTKPLVDEVMALRRELNQWKEE